MTKKLKIGIAGLGNIAATHARAIQALPNTELHSVFSRSDENRSQFRNEFEVPDFSDVHEFLAQPELDAVAICTPTGTHLEIGRLAAKAGKHLIIEKPIEITVERGRELIQICGESDVQLAVIYQNRFSDEVLKMKEALDSGKIGNPVLIRGAVKWYRDQNYYSDSAWRGTFKLDGGGAVINQSIHTIDLIQWLFGDVESVSALTATLTHEGIEAEDNAVAVFKFTSGALGVFEASTSVSPAQPRSIEVNGEKGTAKLIGDQFSLSFTKDSGSKAAPESAGADSPLAGLCHENHRRQYAQIVNAIIMGDEPIVNGHDSLKSLAIVEAIYKSAREKRAVNLF
ncbi:MAG: Gfo/Idh/MocA family oxidoreductase [Balneolaceae bacterium]|nr:Gfo/Idh/MocA family oxidoreductase [Balneolaceae bacterium]